MIQINNCPDLPPRDALGHKATFGKVCVVGGVWGDYPMIGAPALAARAALRSGCGLCVVAVPAPMLPTVLVMVPSATGVALPIDAQQQLLAARCLQILDPVLANTDALVVGPGLGCGTAQQTSKLIGPLMRSSHQRQIVPLLIIFMPAGWKRSTEAVTGQLVRQFCPSSADDLRERIEFSAFTFSPRERVASRNNRGWCSFGPRDNHVAVELAIS